MKRVLWQILDAVEPGNVWDSSFLYRKPGSFHDIDFALWDGVDDFSEPLSVVADCRITSARNLSICRR